MIHFSLFSGIGGFELAAQWMGWKNYVSCEIDDFCNKVRKYYWPDCFHHDNVKTLTFELINEKLSEKYGKDWRNDDIVLTGGFPCQPYSSAGKRLGKDDERHLWPEMLRIIQEVRPTYIVGENVYGLLNWNGGVVFQEVCADLENNGYEVQPVLLPASSIGAPHHRGRIWFIAHTNANSEGSNRYGSTRQANGTIGGKRTQAIHNGIGSDGNKGDAPDTDCNGFIECNDHDEINASQGRKYAQRDINTSHVNGDATDTDSANNETRTQRQVLGQSNREKARRFSNVECKNQWQKFPTQSPICGGDDGISNRLDGITFSSWRKKSLQAYGNAIVPQLAFIIFQTIVKTKQNEQKSTGDGQHSGMD